MNEKTKIKTLEMVRRIRDELAEEVKGKSHSEIIDFYVNAGKLARQEAKRHREGQRQPESCH